MNKVVLLFILTVSLCFNVKAINTDIFKLDESKINSEMAQLNEVENLVSSHLYNSTNPSLPYNILLNNAEIFNPMELEFGISDIQWGSFVWGFCCWPIGVFTVLLDDDKDTNHKISYFIGAGGCLFLSLISAFASPSYYVY